MSPGSHRHDPVQKAARDPCPLLSSSVDRHPQPICKCAFDYNCLDKKMALMCHKRTKATLGCFKLMNLKWNRQNTSNRVPTRSTWDTGLFSSSSGFCTHRKPSHVGFIFFNKIYIYQTRRTVAIINEPY